MFICIKNRESFLSFVVFECAAVFESAEAMLRHCIDRGGSISPLRYRRHSLNAAFTLSVISLTVIALYGGEIIFDEKYFAYFCVNACFCVNLQWLNFKYFVL